ncbi:hypothetical protein AXG93_2145s1580 [Marchantia polymorpha subsp. ruderalis]|uniref:Reverse transcriptase domain-containing protein n=1 Tax=Marchantia polymorpha subsp. ruderalis TaxID=1480154 RepID=A0A176VYH3_MARPO|nr:hypothetical protein AXG93_2145s1580 [Marchantia polymorpha subsp. ruderalis]
MEGMIRLIPKAVNKTELKDWRPLTMLTTDYKIIARILAGRLQMLLQKLVLPQQTGFIKERHMLDNVLTLWMAPDVAKTCRHQGMFVKLDFEKAYDKVEHNYLWDTMAKCELGQQFIALVKGLTLGVSMAMYVNRAKTYRFSVGRGVRQGCPLAPLLFVLATQPPMAEMKMSFQAGRLRGLNQHSIPPSSGYRFSNALTSTSTFPTQPHQHSTSTSTFTAATSTRYKFQSKHLRTVQAANITDSEDKQPSSNTEQAGIETTKRERGTVADIGWRRRAGGCRHHLVLLQYSAGSRQRETLPP